MIGSKRIFAEIAAINEKLALLTAEVKHLPGTNEALAREVAATRALLERFVPEESEKTARQLAEAWGYRGDPENRLYRAFVGIEQPVISPPARIPFNSTLCHQHHFLLDQYRFWAKALKDRPKFARKQWEFVYIAQTLFERGFLTAGKRGVVFGVGQEPLPALFASFGCEIVATDQSLDAAQSAGWVGSGQHAHDLSPLNGQNICTDRMFKELVSFQVADMNDLPPSMDEQFDFVWSACALEHLGSLQKGLDFVEGSLRLLKPGGVAVHTTEFNLSSNTDTIEAPGLSIYRRRDIEGFLAMIIAKGFKTSPIDWTLGQGFAEIVVDLPPFGRGEPHIRLKAGEYDVTSIGLTVEKP